MVETVYTGYIVKKEQRGISFKGKDCNKIEYFDLSVLLIFSFDSNMLQNSECDTELYSHRNMHRKKIKWRLQIQVSSMKSHFQKFVF